jgi:hypothetical protein
MFQAFVDHISHSMVFLLHDSAAFGPSVGTGLLVAFGGKTYIVSARHNFTFQGESGADIARTWNETKFKFRDKGGLRFHATLDIPESSFVLVPGIQFSANSSILISKKHDLIAVQLERDEVMSDQVYSVDLEKSAFTGEIASGASLITIGMPFAGRVKLSSGKTVFYPHTDHVRHEPDLNPEGLPQSYRPEDHIIYRYNNERDGISPKGYSGAPVWANNKDPESEGIWSAQPMIVGIALEYYKKRELIRAVRIKHLIDLLQTELLPELA